MFPDSPAWRETLAADTPPELLLYWTARRVGKTFGPKGAPKAPPCLSRTLILRKHLGFGGSGRGRSQHPAPQGPWRPPTSPTPLPLPAPPRPRAPRAPWLPPPLPPAAAPTPAKPSRPPSSLTQPTAHRHRLPITLRASLPSPPFPSRPPLSCGRLAKGRPRAVGTGILRSYSCNLSPVSFPAMSLSF